MLRLLEGATFAMLPSGCIAVLPACPSVAARESKEGGIGKTKNRTDTTCSNIH